MATSFTSPAFEAPERIWFVDTNLAGFVAGMRMDNDHSPFAHWLDAGRLFMTPATPIEYENNLSLMQPGEPVVAYEKGRGLVAVGWVCDPKDLTDSAGCEALFGDAKLKVRSMRIDWDPSVQRSTADMTNAGFSFTGHALRAYRPGTKAGKSTASRLYLEGIFRTAYHRRMTDLNALEADVMTKVQANRIHTPTTIARIIEARLGQGAFRQAVLKRELACRVTGLSNSDCLVASHIKPWAVCADGEHIDGANGLMLAPHVDYLFDTGLISFTDHGKLVLAASLDRSVLRAWHIDEDINVGAFSPDQALYLAYHRANVLGQPRPRRQRNLVGDAVGVSLPLLPQKLD